MDKKGGFVKVVKNRAYHKRFQVRFRRRRQGKTNYRRRTRMISQDKTRFNIPKYRFVVRVSNKFVNTQIIWAKTVGDEVLCSAHSRELPRYGLPVGLKNYSAVYCTAFLCGRRMLNQLGLDKKYEAVDEIFGEEYLNPTAVEEVEAVARGEDLDGPGPFKCYLDIGLARATVGAKVFAALKGACDAGLYIPHNHRRYPGYKPATKEYDPELHRQRILGLHLVELMKRVQAADEERYARQFSQFVANEIIPDDYPTLVEKCIENITADPTRPSREREQVGPNPLSHRKPRLPLAVRKERIREKKQVMLLRRQRWLDSRM